ncbi:MAG TPA: galactose oxidase-like domain-containing protein [Chthoniobacterales bacterium]|jgi:hypothetical protein
MKTSVLGWVITRLSGGPVTARIVSLAIVIVTSLSFARAQSPVTDGEWTTLPTLMPINPIHCGMLRDGKILVVAGSENDPTEDDYYAGVFDPATGNTAVQELPWDVFCNGMVALPDGRFIVAGGTTRYDPFEGEPRVTVFDPSTEKFNTVEPMADGRWYATATNLGNGSLMAFSGLGDRGVNNTVEIYNLATGWSPEYVAPWIPPLYPRMHLLPNGTVVYTSPTNTTSIFDPSSQTWTVGIAHSIYPNDRTYGTAVILPLRPETGYAPKIVIMGGSSPATSTVELLDLSVPTPAWRSLPPMSEPRIEMNAVILPTGKVLALGGSVIDENPNTASLNGDLFDPVSETWSTAGVATYPRLYHSVALLLPDATVWVAGSNPVRGTYEQHMEIYSPAYLFTTDGTGNIIPATRPVIMNAATEVGYGAPFKMATPDAASISSVVLVRPGAVTHAFDMEQRLIGLSFRQGNGFLKAIAPPNGFLAPPGYYMLFLVNQAGVPSLARFIHLTATPNDVAPNGRITIPGRDLVINAGDTVNFSGAAVDTDGTVTAYSWIFPGGSPEKVSVQIPGPVTFTEVGTQVVSMTPFDNLGVNDPSPATRTITVQPTPEPHFVPNE